RPRPRNRGHTRLPDVQEFGAVSPLARQNLQRLSAGNLQVAATIGAGPRRVVAGIVDPERGIGSGEPGHGRLSLDEVAWWQAGNRESGDEGRGDGKVNYTRHEGDRDG